MNRAMQRRDFLKVAAACAIGAAGGVYVRAIDPRWLEYTEKRLDLWGVSPPLRLLHLSDLHLSSYVPLSFIQEAIEIGLRGKPDLACLTGDYVTGTLRSAEAYARVLRLLADAVPTYAVLGNHDGGLWAVERGGYASTKKIAALLQASGVRLLHNANELVSCAGRAVRLVGVGDQWSDGLDPLQAFSQLRRSEQADRRRIVLCHNPDSKEKLAAHPWDLLLCGHTHGGQVRVPFLRTAPFAPVDDKRFIDGLYPWQGRQLHITRGVGSFLGIRAFCRPEVSMLLIS